jgi:hypothetical protein
MKSRDKTRGNSSLWQQIVKTKICMQLQVIWPQHICTLFFELIRGVIPPFGRELVPLLISLEFVQHGHSSLFRDADGVEGEGLEIGSHVEGPGRLIFVVDRGDVDQGCPHGQEYHVPCNNMQGWESGLYIPEVDFF